MENNGNSPADSFIAMYLPTFIANNPACRIDVKDDNICLIGLWGESGPVLELNKNGHEAIHDLNNIMVDRRFDAIIHIDNNTIEFIFDFIDPSNESAKDILIREFCFTLNGESYNCKYGEPTQRLWNVAKCHSRKPAMAADNIAYQLRKFQDFQHKETWTEWQKKYFENRKPCSFFIETQRPILNVDIEGLSRQLNTVMRYYDRETPEIVIRSSDVVSSEDLEPLRYIDGSFPTRLNVLKMDDFILQLIDIANSSYHRFSFVYYYQVLEYAGYYYIDNALRRDIRLILRDPAAPTCNDDVVERLVHISSEIHSSDEEKIRRAVEEYCNPSVLWREVSHDREFFSAEINFDGGFSSKALIGKDETIDTWNNHWSNTVVRHLSKVRNYIVHAREKRNSIMILPTERNNELISRYLPLIRRIAEQIAITRDVRV